MQQAPVQPLRAIQAPSASTISLLLHVLAAEANQSLVAQHHPPAAAQQSQWLSLVTPVHPALAAQPQPRPQPQPQQHTQPHQPQTHPHLQPQPQPEPQPQPQCLVIGLNSSPGKRQPARRAAPAPAFHSPLIPCEAGKQAVPPVPTAPEAGRQYPVLTNRRAAKVADRYLTKRLARVRKHHEAKLRQTAKKGAGGPLRSSGGWWGWLLPRAVLC